MKRVYAEAGVAAEPGGFGVRLDDRPVRTPAKRPLVVPSAALAEAIAAEWRAQGETVDPRTMPLMRLACTALDRVDERREAVIAELLAYARTDLLCYRAEAPVELAQREAAAWQPLLDWAALRYDAPLRVTAGIVPVDQPEQSIAALGAALALLDGASLTAMATLAPACGSLVLALALHEGRIDAATAVDLTTLDERFQIERWGEDEEAALRRRAIALEIDEAAQFLTLLRRA